MPRHFLHRCRLDSLFKNYADEVGQRCRASVVCIQKILFCLEGNYTNSVALIKNNMFRSKFITVTSCVLGGYFAGLATEKFYGFPKKEIENPFNWDSIQPKPKPGLPIFGTVSAASMVPAKPNIVNQPKSVPPEPAFGAPRVSQVK